MKHAHIASRPNHQLGDRVLGLCGKDFKVKILWADIPDDMLICRVCVDTALKAMTEADALIGHARNRSALVTRMAEHLNEVVGKELRLDVIAETDQAHRDLIEEKQEKKELKRLNKLAAVSTCTCSWRDKEIYDIDPKCPIHGGDEDEPEIVTTEEKTED